MISNKEKLSVKSKFNDKDKYLKYTFINYSMIFVINFFVSIAVAFCYLIVRSLLVEIIMVTAKGYDAGNCVLNLFISNIFSMIIFHILFKLILSRLENFYNRIVKFLVDKELYPNKEYLFNNSLDRFILLSYIWVFIIAYINKNTPFSNYSDFNLQVIAIYFILYSIFNSKAEKNY